MRSGPRVNAVFLANSGVLLGARLRSGFADPDRQERRPRDREVPEQRAEARFHAKKTHVQRKRLVLNDAPPVCDSERRRGLRRSAVRVKRACHSVKQTHGQTNKEEKRRNRPEERSHLFHAG